MTMRLNVLVLLPLAVSLPLRGAAQSAPRCSWPDGEPKEDRDAFDALVREGNDRMGESLYPLALDTYRRALARCEHPGGHYNVALALMQLDRPLEMRDELARALEHGPQPLAGEQRFEHAKNYLKLLEGQLVKVKVRCDVPGAHVSVDGEELFTPPGVGEKWLRPGRHYIVAAKPEYVSNEVGRSFEAGARPSLDLKLATEEELTVYERRWNQALPWSFIGAGFAVGLAGGGLYYEGLKVKRDAQATATDQCPNGCAPGLSNMAVKKTQSANLRAAAVGAFAVGGASLVTGGVLLYLNRAHAVRRSYEVSIAPILDTQTHGAQVAVAF